MVMMTRTRMTGTTGWMSILNGSEKIESSLGCCRCYTDGGHHSWSIYDNVKQRITCSD